MRAGLETNKLYKKLVSLTTVPWSILPTLKLFPTDSRLRCDLQFVDSSREKFRFTHQTTEENSEDGVSLLPQNLSRCDAKSSTPHSLNSRKRK
jgi:hypothetical protein